MPRTDQAPSFRPVANERRFLQVAEQILTALADRQLSPGDRLPSDRELAQDMRVSRPTVREALLALELLGVVRVFPGDGAYIVGPTEPRSVSRLSLDANPRELVEARAALEPHTAALAARRANPDALSELTESFSRSSTLSQAPEKIDDFIESGLHFHKVLAGYCGNHFLTETVHTFVSVGRHPLWILVNRMIMRDPAARRRQLDEHKVIMDAVLDGDERAAETRMQKHLELLDAQLFSVEPWSQ